MTDSEKKAKKLIRLCNNFKIDCKNCPLNKIFLLKESCDKVPEAIKKIEEWKE